MYFKINERKDSYTGFEFGGDFGYITTDFHQLSHGPAWINQVISHSTQCGFIISASDDWCIMIWKFIENEDEKITFTPLLKINTGLEVKAIAMSKWGNIMAAIATCFDDEEDHCSPELQLYFDNECQWCFNSENCNPCNNKKMLQDLKRNVQRKIVTLPFQPVCKALEITNDGKYAFIAMYSSYEIIDELKTEREEDGLNTEDILDDPISLICVKLDNQKIIQCLEFSALLDRNEYCHCFCISPDGKKIAIGTNEGKLIIYHDINDLIENKPLLKNKNCTVYKNDDRGVMFSICWSENSKWIICGYCGVIQIWRKKKFKCEYEMYHTLEGQMCFRDISRMNVIGCLLICGGYGGDINIYNLKDVYMGKLDSKAMLVDRIDGPHDGRMVTSVINVSNYCADCKKYIVSVGADDKIKGFVFEYL